MRLAPSRAISSSVSVISPACTEEVSVDSLSMGGVSFPPPASGVFVCWAHAEGYAALFHPIKSRDPQLLRIPPHRLARGAWKEYDACAPSGCLRVQGILLGGSPRILRLQTVFRILNSARSCRIRVYQLMFKFEMALTPGCAGTALAIPTAVWDSWQKFLGAPTLVHDHDGSSRLALPGPKTQHLPAFIYVFEFDAASEKTPSPMQIRKVIRTSAEALS